MPWQSDLSDRCALPGPTHVPSHWSRLELRPRIRTRGLRRKGQVRVDARCSGISKTKGALHPHCASASAAPATDDELISCKGLDTCDAIASNIGEPCSLAAIRHRSVRDVSGRDPHLHRPRQRSSRSRGGERCQKSDRIFEMRPCCGGALSAHNGCAAPSSPCCTRACVHRPSGDHARCRALSTRRVSRAQALRPPVVGGRPSRSHGIPHTSPTTSG